jgi:GH43 family beta-xylosidase
MSDLFPIDRRQLLTAGAALPLAGVAQGRVTRQEIINPLVLQRADAQIVRHGQYFYFTASVPEYDRLILRRSRTIAGLRAAPESVLWRRPAQGRMGGYIWAPEIHHFDGRWHVYFAAGDSDEKFRIRTYVLQSADPDPTRARWTLLGQLQTPWDTFTLDSTIFEHKGARYICWAQSEPGIKSNSNIYLAPLKTATTLAAPPVRLTMAELPWERLKYRVAEGPALLARNGKLFLTYSVNSTDRLYCMGMLTADADSNIMDPASWTKSAEPVFSSSPDNNVWGPGHNSFVVDERGRDLLVYHARDYKEITGDSLLDPNRHTRVQPFRWRRDGTPDFSVPVKNGALNL